MIALLLALCAHADEITDALVGEMERGRAELTLPDAPPIYHLRYHLLRLDQVDVEAAFGGLVHAGDDPFNAVAVEVRVGTPEFDNTNFGGWQTGFDRSWAPDRITPYALGVEAWRMTDRAYKEAVEQYARKAAQFDAPDEYPGDYTLIDEVPVKDEGAGEVAERAPLEALATRLSRAMVVAPSVERADVFMGHEAGSLTTVDTAGARLRRPVEETTVRAVVHVRAADGMLLTDHRLYTVRPADDLPDADAMEREVRAMAERLAATASAPVLGDEYVGPVLFEDEAAADLFRWLLVPQLEGTPSEIPFDTWLGEIGESNDPVRLKRRVLPPGWRAVDDPLLDPSHPASFSWDAEGTPARAVELVDDGIVQSVLMSRIPRKGVDGTNGHARGTIGTRLSGRASMTYVRPGQQTSEKKMRKKALKIASAYGLDHVLVVRRLQEPAVRALADGPFSSETAALPPPVSVFRVYANGREEEVRGASFAGVQRWVLRDVLAAGELVEASYMAPFSRDGWHLGPTEGMPSWISAPEVLIGEMELVPAPGDPRERPVAPPPAIAFE